MKLHQALKEKNRLAREIAGLKTRITEQNCRPTTQPFDYVMSELLDQVRAKIDQLVRLMAAIGRANGEVYEHIFRLAELRGLVETLNSVPTQHGTFLSGAGNRYGERQEVLYQAQLRKAEVDRLVAQAVDQMAGLQDELDRFNARHEVEVEGG